MADFAKVVVGKTTANEVRALLGSPSRTQPARGQIRESWAYPYRGNYDRRVFWVELSADGIVRATVDMLDSDARPYRF